jgi:CheY-like chemotaxis protein
MNGFEVLEALKSNRRWSEIPVVVMSANRGYSAQDLVGTLQVACG